MLNANDIEVNPGPDKHKSKVNICHANIRSLRNKMHHVQVDLAGKFDIITLSETWLKSSIRSQNFKLNGYHFPYRRDCNSGRDEYGGVLAWVSSDIPCKHRRDLESPTIE